MHSIAHWVTQPDLIDVVPNLDTHQVLVSRQDGDMVETPILAWLVTAHQPSIDRLSDGPEVDHVAFSYTFPLTFASYRIEDEMALIGDRNSGRCFIGGGKYFNSFAHGLEMEETLSNATSRPILRRSPIHESSPITWITPNHHSELVYGDVFEGFVEQVPICAWRIICWEEDVDYTDARQETHVELFVSVTPVLPDWSRVGAGGLILDVPRGEAWGFAGRRHFSSFEEAVAHLAETGNTRAKALHLNTK